MKQRGGDVRLVSFGLTPSLRLVVRLTCSVSELARGGDADTSVVVAVVGECVQS